MKKLLSASQSALFALSLAFPAFAADLPSRKAAPIIAPTPPMWTGFYAGLNIGAGIGAAPNVQTNGYSIYQWQPGSPGLPFGFTAPYRTGNAVVDQSGIIGGGQIGYNYNFNQNILLGVEADFQGASISGRGASYGAIAATDQIGTTHLQHGVVSTDAGVAWLGTARARVGYLVTPAILVYGTGGFAYGNTYANVVTHGFHWHPGEREDSRPIPVTPTWSSIDNLSVGWTAGGGGEWMFMQNWSAKAEALYYDLGSQSVNGQYSPLYNPVAPNTIAILNAANTTIDARGIIARAGVNYHFNWGTAPVVASY
jgi:outer membrane immunogenic protein